MKSTEIPFVGSLYQHRDSGFNVVVKNIAWYTEQSKWLVVHEPSGGGDARAVSLPHFQRDYVRFRERGIPL